VNFTPGIGVSGKYWFCDGLRICEIPQLPSNAQRYKTYSVYYASGAGFWVLNGDARNPPNTEAFHKLHFEYYDHNNDYSSYLTHAGQHPALRLQPQDRNWVDMLLPSIYHSHTPAPNNQYGGVIGELPIFLALMAFTTPREYLPTVLPRMFNEGRWITHHQWQQPSTLCCLSRYKYRC
jgi:hypothetical protein